MVDYLNLKEILASVGLSDKEALVQTVLLQEGSLRVRQIVALTNLNRTTIYGILKKLIKEGLVSSSNKGGITEYQSIEPGLFLSYFERKKNELSETQKEYEKILPHIKNIKKHKDLYPKIRFFEGVEGIKQAYEDTLENNKEKQILDISGTDAVYKVMGKKWVDYYINRRAKLNIQCKVIAPHTGWSRFSKENDCKYLRETKLLPVGYLYENEINIYDNKVATFSFTSDPPVALIIEDKTLSDMLRNLFRYIDSTI